MTRNLTKKITIQRFYDKKKEADKLILEVKELRSENSFLKGKNKNLTNKVHRLIGKIKKQKLGEVKHE